MSKQPTLLVPGSLRLGGERALSDEVPVEYIVAWIRRRMPEYGGRAAAVADRVLVVRAETGSGKSTTLPVAVFRILRGMHTPVAQAYRGGGVICTQPRVLTAIALANDVSSRPWNPDMVLGVTVGYQTGPVSNRAPTGLIYATAGVLAVQLRNLEDAEIMERYRIILVDEAHERALDSDMMLMLLRNFYLRNVGNPRLPFLLLTSATFDTLRYTAYFGVGPDNAVEVVGRAYPIATHWPETGVANYPAAAAEVALKIHADNPGDPPARADILIFMPGGGETITVATALAAAAPQHGERPYLVLIINREVVVSQTGDFPLLFERPERLPLVRGVPPARRIIVSTVVAETGLTIDTLRYVIDCGWSRMQEVYPEGVQGLVTRPAPRSRIEQRKGRAGRLFPGDFYPLYTQNVHAALEAQQLPDIIALGAADIHLAAIREQQRQKVRTGLRAEFRVEDLALLDPPTPEAFLAANAVAVALGYVSECAALPAQWPPAALLEGAEAAGGDRGYGLTALGHVAAMFSRASMEGVRAILAGYVWGCAAPDLITAVAMFGVALPDLLVGRGRVKRGAEAPPLPIGSAALREALPAYLVQRVGGGVAGALPPADSEAFYFRARLLIADDFAEAVLLYDAFARYVAAAHGDVSAVAAWCEAAGLSFVAMQELARRRDKIIEEAFSAGIDPFRGADRCLAQLPAEDFTEGVRAFKRCLYDGLRARLLRWDPQQPGGGSYVSLQGVRVRTPGLFSDAMASRLRALHVTRSSAGEQRPRWLLTDHIRLAPAPKMPGDGGPPLLYVADTNLVSVLDGYVDPDPGFTAARSFGAP
jgi:hypothetical protein